MFKIRIFFLKYCCFIFMVLFSTCACLARFFLARKIRLFLFFFSFEVFGMLWFLFGNVWNLDHDNGLRFNSIYTQAFKHLFEMSTSNLMCFSFSYKWFHSTNKTKIIFLLNWRDLPNNNISKVLNTHKYIKYLRFWWLYVFFIYSIHYTNLVTAWLKQNIIQLAHAFCFAPHNFNIIIDTSNS